MLLAEGTSRQELGREAFEERVWEWLHEYGGKILVQFRRMGASLDYRRTRFTMDDGYIRAVMRFFVHLYRRGWIYRANRIINWCPYHETSLSDLELEHVDVDDTLSTIRYPLADGDGYIAIATVRPATIPADVAVAVHPDDDRYKHLVGREVIVPWVERRVPVIADERVEREFGTGALKITPGHDPTDFEIGRDHGLPEPRCIGPGRARHGRRGARRADAGGGGGEDPRLAEGARPAREARALPAQRRALRALRDADRAADLAAVVVLDGGAQAAGAGGAARAARRATTPRASTASRSTRSRTRPTGTSRGRSGGATRSRSGTARTGTSRCRRRAGGVRRVRLDRADARDGRARHVVLVGALAVRDARLARRDARTSRTSIPATCRRPRARSSASGRTG